MQLKTFLLKNFCANKISPIYNYGSLNYELKAQENSSLEAITDLSNEFKEINEKTYFEFLKQKYMVDEHYQPIPHEKIRIGENFV